MLNTQSFNSKTFLLPLLSFLILIILGVGFYLGYYLPKTKYCPFANKSVCLTGKRYEKNQWQGELAGQAFKLKNSQKITAPFDGKFLFSSHTNINFENQHLGVVYSLTFENEELGTMGLLANKAYLLRGNVAELQEVKAGEIVAEIHPEGISFLDNYSVIKLGPIK